MRRGPRVRAAPILKLLDRDGGVNSGSTAEDSEAVRTFLRLEGGLGRCVLGGETVELLRLRGVGSTERARFWPLVAAADSALTASGSASNDAKC